MAVREEKPLYLAGFLGGAAEQVIDALEGKRMPEDFCPSLPGDLYQRFADMGGHVDAQSDHFMDREAIWQEFADTGVAGLAAVNGLSIEHNTELHHTLVIDQVTELVLNGLSNLHQFGTKQMEM